jgi:hypothetical protein
MKGGRRLKNCERPEIDGVPAPRFYTYGRSGIFAWLNTATGAVEQRKADEYNALKVELMAGRLLGCDVLIWVNPRTEWATIRVRPTIFCVCKKELRERLLVLGVTEISELYMESAFRFSMRFMDPDSRAGNLVRLLESIREKYPAGREQVAPDTNNQPQEEEQDEMSRKIFPVVVREIKRDGEKEEVGAAIEGYNPKFVDAANAETARDAVMVELVKDEKYGEIEEPKVRITVCNPLVKAGCC